MKQQTVETKREPKPLNGVDTPTLFATINAVKEQPELAKFRFRASNRWVNGTNSRGRMESFTGAGAEHTHGGDFQYDADHPTVLCGTDVGPTPVEFVLHALAACLTAGIANIAAARGVTLSKVESTVEGNMDMRGILGLSDEVRNGYENIRVSFKIKGDAPPEKLRQIVEQSRARSVTPSSSPERSPRAPSARSPTTRPPATICPATCSTSPTTSRRSSGTFRRSRRSTCCSAKR